jgi:shikimate dehydrogenase
MSIDAQTRLCALVGNPVEHSFSPLIHNAAFKATGLNFVYVAFRVEKSRIGEAITGIRALNIRGTSVTIPHKVSALRFLDQLDPLAEKIGSINTIVNDGGILKGYNSDGAGALKAIQGQGVALDEKSVLVLGSGGAARAITFTLAMRTKISRLTIAGIVKNELATLAGDLQRASEVPIKTAILADRFFEQDAPAADVLINCTPVGMYPEVDSSPVPADFFQNSMAVFDVVYNPLKTKLLSAAEQAGCTIISGVEMFINQAAVQFQLWTGEKAPEDVMREVVLEHVGL